MTPLGVGIIGCGTISAIYLQNMTRFPGLRLTACADLREDAAQRCGRETRRIGAQPRCAAGQRRHRHRGQPDGAGRAFRREPCGARRRQACVQRKAALRRDRARTHAGAEAEPARPQARLRARHVPWRRRAARARNIDSGQIGKVLSGTCFLMSHGMEHWHPDPEFYFKPGGGPILDMAPYYLAALINLLGPVASVQARTSTGFPERVVTAAGPRKGQPSRSRRPPP